MPPTAKYPLSEPSTHAREVVDESFGHHCNRWDLKTGVHDGGLDFSARTSSQERFGRGGS